MDVARMVPISTAQADLGRSYRVLGHRSPAPLEDRELSFTCRRRRAGERRSADSGAVAGRLGQTTAQETETTSCSIS
jgi:hypothetical protein